MELFVAVSRVKENTELIVDQGTQMEQLVVAVPPSHHTRLPLSFRPSEGKIRSLVGTRAELEPVHGSYPS